VYLFIVLFLFHFLSFFIKRTRFWKDEAIELTTEAITKEE
jgi:hypothetical protein